MPAGLTFVLQGGPNYHEKYRIYRVLYWLMLILGIYVIISYIVFVVGAYRDKLDGWWRSWWYFDFYGEFAFFAVMIVLMSSWRPGRDPRKYSYQPLVLGSPQAPAPTPAPSAATPSFSPATAVPVTSSASPAQQPASYASL